MQLPNAEAAHVPKEKITEYLLNPAHQDAQAKAPFFLACGFQPEEWELFAQVLTRHAAAFEVAQTKQLPYGMIYTVEGPLPAVAGTLTTRPVRSVWIIEEGKNFPRLVSAYPINA